MAEPSTGQLVKGALVQIGVAALTGAIVAWVTLSTGAAVRDEKLRTTNERLERVERKLDQLRERWIEQFGRLSYRRTERPWGDL